MIKIERKTYDNEKDFVYDIYFKWMGFGKGTIYTEGVIDHERKHFNSFKEKGYCPKYGMRKITINLLGILDLTQKLPYVSVKDVKPLDLKEGCLAPEDPSIADKFMASKLFMIPYSIYWRFKK